MRNIRKIAAIIVALITTGLYAQDCILPVSIALDEDFSNIPLAAKKVAYNSLNRIATSNGLTTESPTTPFILTMHCDVLDKSNLPGPPIKTVYNLGVTLYLADTYTQKKFSTTYLELKGVGTGEVKSYINAFQRLTANRNGIIDMMEEGKKKMLSYYDTQYENIINEAKRLVSIQKYEEALMNVLSIPRCSKGGKVAAEFALSIYSKYLDRLNLLLLNKARALWTAGQDQQTAFDVCELLSQIDPDADCYNDASKLMNEVKAQVRADIDFEMRQKYTDAVEQEKARIEAARAVGVAFGKGQQPTTTNLMWLK